MGVCGVLFVPSFPGFKKGMSGGKKKGFIGSKNRRIINLRIPARGEGLSAPVLLWAMKADGVTPIDFLNLAEIQRVGKAAHCGDVLHRGYGARQFAGVPGEAIKVLANGLTGLLLKRPDGSACYRKPSLNFSVFSRVLEIFLKVFFTCKTGCCFARFFFSSSLCLQQGNKSKTALSDR